MMKQSSFSIIETLIFLFKKANQIISKPKWPKLEGKISGTTFNHDLNNLISQLTFYCIFIIFIKAYKALKYEVTKVSKYGNIYADKKGTY